MADISAMLAQFSDTLGEGVTTLYSLLSNLATFFALVTGLASLFFGRRLFWIFVATVGFIVGVHLAPMMYPYLPPVMEPFQDVIGLSVALVLAGTAVALQRFATIIFGAVALGIVGYMIAGSADSVEWVQWFFTALFGLAGGLLLYFFFDWTLILVSVFVGSAIAIFGARATGGIPTDYGLWLFGLLLAAGLIYQGNDLRVTARTRASSAAKNDAAKQDGIAGAPNASAPKTSPIPPSPANSAQRTAPSPAAYAPPMSVSPAAAVPVMSAPRVALFPTTPTQSAPIQQNAQTGSAYQVAAPYPPTLSNNPYYAQTYVPDQVAAPLAPVAVAAAATTATVIATKPTVAPETMAPPMTSQGSMSFSDLWKWTPWRKSDGSGTVPSDSSTVITTLEAPFQSSPNAMG